MPRFTKLLRAALPLLTLAAAPYAAAADAYPSKPIRMVVPFAAGSGTDAVARITAKELGDALKANVVVDNRPGANGAIAAEIVAQAAPDGYTLFMTTNTTHSANPSLMKKLSYDPIRDFTPVARMGNLPFILVVNPKLPVKTVPELIAYARAHPGMSYASTSTCPDGSRCFPTMAGTGRCFRDCDASHPCPMGGACDGDGSCPLAMGG